MLNTTTEKIKVLVADDHPAFREGLCLLLRDEDDIEVIAKPEDGEDTVRLAKELKPDVAIIDVAMPKVNGIEAARQIGKACPDTAILMISAYDYESYILASLQAGVAGYLLKTAPLRELVSAIRMVHFGEAVFDLKATRNILHRISTDGTNVKRSAEELKLRELEVLKAAAKGISNRAIAKELVISERTVQTHFVNIFRKLEVSSRTEAVLRALKKGWITQDDLP